MTDPIAPPPRYPSLDILRGVAVMGILAMNAAAFALPEPAYYNPTAYGGAHGLDLATWFAGFLLFDGKMRGLFSLLFGASMLLVIQSAEAKDESGGEAHFRRMAWLILFGALHFYLLWWGDILLHYALIGLIAYQFRALNMSRLLLWVAILLGVDIAIMGSLTGNFLTAQAAAAAPGASPAAIARWQHMASVFGPLSPAELAEQLRIHRGSYGEILRYRLAEQGSIPFSSIGLIGAETLAFMLLGMAGLKSGFLTGAWRAATYRWIAGGGIAIGGAGFAALAIWMMRSGFDPAIVAAANLAGTVLARVPMILGYAALIILLSRHGGAIAARVGAAGRAAFTNYLGTSLIMTTLFYGYGLGLFGRLGRAELALVVIAMWALMLAWSKPWLDRYRYGPFEWLWRSLARWRPQPMRRALRA